MGEYMNEHLYVNHASPTAAMPKVWSTLRSIIQKRKSNSKQLPGILDIYLEALELEASDPRDKVWALLAFGRETETNDNEPLSDGIRPNYTKSPAQMFADFTRWCILEQKSLRVLSAVHGLRGRTWQSLHWTPTPAPTMSRSSWAVGCMGEMKWARATLQQRFNYRAGGDTMIDLELIKHPPNPTILTLKGYRVDRILHIGYPSLQQSLQIRPKLFEAFITIFDLTRTQETWNAGRIGLQGQSPMFEFQKRFDEHQQAHWMYGPRPLPVVIRTDEIATENGEISTSKEASIPSCIDPCFFVGDNRWCGLCPSGAQIGDMAVILLGAEVPFLLRQSTESDGHIMFEFVGECYIEGAMNGEVVEASAANHVLPETFSLI